MFKIYRIFSLVLSLSLAGSLFTFAQPVNVLISNTEKINEPSIMVNPQNTDNWVAGSNLDLYYYSDDGGESWQEGQLNSTYKVWGDPSIIADDSGHFYYFHLSNPPFGNWIDRIVCQKSTDGGQHWDNGTFTGLNNKKVQDKEWAIFDRKTRTVYLTWTQFDVYAPVTNPSPEDSSVILFSKSEDYGNTWSTPQRLNKTAGDCWDDDKTVEGAVPAVGPLGELYVCWAFNDTIYFDRSMDGGNSWLRDDIVVTDQPGGWNYEIPGIYRCNGLPVIACDTGNSQYKGSIYINWSDQRNGKDNTDIWLAKSTDKGNTWSAPVRVNNDNGTAQQFFTWMSVDPFTGYIFIVFYDRRNYSDLRTDVYLAISKDGGAHFDNYRISETPFVPDKSVFFGDYTNIVAFRNHVRPIWTRLDSNRHSLWTALIDTPVLSVYNKPQPSPVITRLAPNPSPGQTYFSFTLRSNQFVSMFISDQTGKQIKVLYENKLTPAGKYIQTINGRKLGLSAGFYYIILKTESGTTSKKLILIH